MSIIELAVARGHLEAAAGLYDNADTACGLRIQMAQAEVLLVIAQELRRLNDSVSQLSQHGLLMTDDSGPHPIGDVW